VDREHFEGEYRYTLVCVDSYEDRVLSGRLYNPLWSEGILFTSAVDMIRALEKLMDKLDVPHQLPALRTFETREFDQHPFEVQTPPTGALATFQLRILYRRHASWQGSILWVDENRTEAFRSTMELLLLMDSALRKA